LFNTLALNAWGTPKNENLNHHHYCACYWQHLKAAHCTLTVVCFHCERVHCLTVGSDSVTLLWPLVIGTASVWGDLQTVEIREEKSLIL